MGSDGHHIEVRSGGFGELWGTVSEGQRFPFQVRILFEDGTERVEEFRFRDFAEWSLSEDDLCFFVLNRFRTNHPPPPPGPCFIAGGTAHDITDTLGAVTSIALVLPIGSVRWRA
ncbi:unnamed protein product [Eruca vesicaria subsp. sativa]|uniref:Uncharacterized protein n=1 Tax=Eruca vesicaria subsp. sativa TaxID=29727 RepID=A0ABC8L3E6_ERUVS|nr:unnamed protein product [Eruca vesicaria subsp. sativa]